MIIVEYITCIYCRCFFFMHLQFEGDIRLAGRLWQRQRMQPSRPVFLLTSAGSTRREVEMISAMNLWRIRWIEGFQRFQGTIPTRSPGSPAKMMNQIFINSFLGQGKNNPEINCCATNDFMICPYIVFLLYRRSAWCWWHLVKATDTKMLPVLPCTLCAASQHRCLCSTSWCVSIHFNVSYVAVIHDSSRVHTIDTISLRSFLFT